MKQHEATMCSVIVAYKHKAAAAAASNKTLVNYLMRLPSFSLRKAKQSNYRN